MIKFIKTKTPNCEFDHADITFQIDNNDLDRDDLMEEFELFLLAIGYPPEVEYDTEVHNIEMANANEYLDDILGENID